MLKVTRSLNKKIYVLKGRKSGGMKNAASPTEKEPKNNNDNEDVCHKCHKFGHLLMCDSCPKSYHLGCSDEKAIPEGDWFCSICKKTASENDDFCYICNQIGEVIMCSTCTKSFHAVCLDKSTDDFDSIPDGKWSCPSCEEKAI